MTIKEELQAVYDLYAEAYGTGNAVGCAAFFAEDGELFSPYGPVARGRAEIEAVHVEWTQEEDSGNKQITVTDANASGDVAWCLVEFREGASAIDGYSLNALQRQPLGNWLIKKCSLNEYITSSE